MDNLDKVIGHFMQFHSEDTSISLHVNHTIKVQATGMGGVRGDKIKFAIINLHLINRGRDEWL